jgi:hypothetical protein
VTRWLQPLLALLCATVAADAIASDKLRCGKKPPKWATVEDIHMSGPSPADGATPVYYQYLGHAGTRLYLRPADVTRTIDDLIERHKARGWGSDTTALERLATEIARDQPLSDHTDLGKYSLRDPAFHITLQYVLSEALRRGRASIGDDWYFRADASGKVTTPGGVSWQMIRYDTLRLYSDNADEPTFIRMFCTTDGFELWQMQYQIE